MAQNNYMYEWRKAKTYWHEDENGRIVMHDDAPQEVLDSYAEYQRIMGELVEFPKRKTTGLFDFDLWKKQDSSKKQARAAKPKADPHVRLILDGEEKKEMMHALGGLEEETIELYASLPFWAYENDGFIVFKKQKQRAKVLYVYVREDKRRQGRGKALLKAGESYFHKEGVDYFSALVDEEQARFFNQAGFVEMDETGMGQWLYVKKGGH